MSVAVNKNGLFAKLPGELQNRIFSYLDYPSAIFLARTNQYFRRVVRLSTTPTNAERLAIVQILELSFGSFLFRLFACTTCFRLKPREEFGVAQIKKHGKGTPENPRSCHRFCLDCGIDEGYYGADGASREVKVFEEYNNPQKQHLVEYVRGERYLLARQSAPKPI
ncbi:uncharacterized protein J3D65DRAFT_643221 [Phyllosticta citribraziliensis]|uniref:F-box domain-containing protein n=1 Tax=Phyllosticta citribraziliensis TaxID=989973 RepID=A0ABR1L312_9PEZI